MNNADSRVHSRSGSLGGSQRRARLQAGKALEKVLVADEGGERTARYLGRTTDATHGTAEGPEFDGTGLS
jgi:hypothetical protein